jgi:hypothetical protein
LSDEEVEELTGEIKDVEVANHDGLAFEVASEADLGAILLRDIISDEPILPDPTHSTAGWYLSMPSDGPLSWGDGVAGVRMRCRYQVSPHTRYFPLPRVTAHWEDDVRPCTQRRRMHDCAQTMTTTVSITASPNYLPPLEINFRMEGIALAYENERTGSAVPT